MDNPEVITRLIAEGGVAFYAAAVTFALIAVWRQWNKALDRNQKQAEDCGKEGRELQNKFLDAAAAMNLQMQANTQAIEALRRDLERRQ